jgi:predicted outer membrane protein
MRSSLRSTGLVALAAVSIVTFGCSRGGTPERGAATNAPRKPVAAVQSGGDVAPDSSTVTKVDWLTDANILSLLAAMNSQQIAASDVELQAWRSDTIRALAAATAREHAELQHSADSLAAQLHISPVAPALASQFTATMQAQLDSLNGDHQRGMDRAFIAQQVSAGQLMLGYIQGLAGSAQAPQLQALLSSAAMTVGAELTRARGLQMILARADSSAVADSAKADSARAARSRRPRR